MTSILASTPIPLACSGLFWTVRIPTDAVHVNLDAGTASLRVAGQHVRDFFNIPNSMNNGHSVGATVSYAIRWHGVKKRRHVHNETLHVTGLFLDTHATIDWTGHNANGFHFASDDEGRRSSQRRSDTSATAFSSVSGSSNR